MAINQHDETAQAAEEPTLKQRIFQRIKKASTYDNAPPAFKLSDLSKEERAIIETTLEKPVEEIDVEILRLVKLFKEMPLGPYEQVLKMYRKGGAGNGHYMDPDISYLIHHRIVPENYLKNSYDLTWYKLRPEVMYFLKNHESLWLRPEHE